MILCEIILIHAFRWHIKRSQRNRSQQQLEVYNICMFLWNIFCCDLEHDFCQKVIQLFDAKASVAHISWHVLTTCLVTNSLTTPTHLDKNDRVSFDQRNHPSVRFLSSAYGENYNKIQPIPNLSHRGTWGTFKPGTQQAWDLFEKLSLNLWKYQQMHIIEVHVWVTLNDPKQFYLCLWLDKCSSLETKEGIVYVKSEIVAYFLASSSFWL